MDDPQVAILERILSPWRRHWPSAARPSRSGQWHLTLRFLGQGRPQQAATLLRLLDAGDAAWPGLDLRLAGFGGFPRVAAARVLWLGLATNQGMQGLLDLVREMEALAQRAGYPAEAKPFRPHLTLCRFPSPIDLASCLAKAPRLDLAWSPDRLVLFHSQLLPSGARHMPVWHRRLGAEAPCAGDLTEGRRHDPGAGA